MSIPEGSKSTALIVQNVGSAVIRIILNRPQALNAISVDLLDDLVHALREHANARIIILEGAGDRAFCAGEDLKQTLAPRTGTPAELREALNKFQDITRLTASASAIVIAVVQGFAVGGGAEIALAADFVIGGPRARFRFPEAAIGHAVTNGISSRLVQLVGLLKAKELLLTGRCCDAKEAFSLGMLTEVVDNPKERAVQLAMELAKLPHIALTASKTSLERAVFPNMENCLHDEVNVASYCFAQPDAQDTFANFATRNAVSSTSPEIFMSSTKMSQDIPRDAIAVRTNAKSFRAVDHSIRDMNSAWTFVVNQYQKNVFLRCEGQDLTFAAFEERVSQLAGGLQHLDVGIGDRVVVMMLNSIDAVCSWLAVNRLGAIWAPINTELRSISLAHVMKAAEPKLMLIDHDLLEEVTAANIVDVEHVWIKGSKCSHDMSHLFRLGSPVTLPVEVSPASTAAFLNTSGTTGRSKPCMIPHEYFITGARTLISGCDLRQSDVLFCPFPLCHADATAYTVVPAILLGATAALAPRFSASRFWHEIRTTRATIYDFMGATLALTYKQPPSPLDRKHHVRLAWGVPIPSFAQEYEERFGHKLVTLYGSVETNLPIFQDLNRPLPKGSCGRASPGYSVRIGNAFDEELPPNTPGQILVRSEVPTAVFGGYYKHETQTLAVFQNMWLHTEDIGSVDKDGNVYFIGRLKDVVRRRGENINATEVEEEFLQHPEVIIAAAYGVPSLLGGGTEEDLKVVVKTRGLGSPSERELWEWARSRMSRFQIPDVIEVVDDIPRTSTGKLEKHKLNSTGGSRFELQPKAKL